MPPRTNGSTTKPNNIGLGSFIEGAPISNGVGLLNPNEDEAAKALGDEFVAEVKANIIGDFEKDGDKMVHVSSFTIIDNIVYMTYYANTASALEDAKHQEARLAYCPLDNPADLTVINIQKVGDKVEVVSGIFAGYSGVLREISEDKKQVVILASTERRDIPIMVEIQDVRLAQ